MSIVVEYLLNKASEAHIIEHLISCDADFEPVLSARVDINDYARKIVSKAMRFEAWSGDKLVGLLAVYCNDQDKLIAYITNVSVLHKWMHKGIASRMMKQCIEYLNELGMRQISLEVAVNNLPAIRLYENNSFVAGKVNGQCVGMNLNLESKKKYE